MVIIANLSSHIERLSYNAYFGLISVHFEELILFLVVAMGVCIIRVQFQIAGVK